MEVRYAALETFDGDTDGMTFRGVAIPYNTMATIISAGHAPTV